MTQPTTNQATTSHAVSLASIPPNVNAAQHDFASENPLRFVRSGALSPASRNTLTKIDWNKSQRPAHVVKASEATGVDHFTPTPVPTALVSAKSDRERFKLYQLPHPCGEHYYVPERI